MRVRFIFYFIDNFIDKLVYKSVSKIITVSLSCIESIEIRNNIFKRKKFCIFIMEWMIYIMKI